MSTTTLKKSTPERNTGADCPICQSCRDSGANFCRNCGKQLTEPTMPMNYDLPNGALSATEADTALA